MKTALLMSFIIAYCILTLVIMYYIGHYKVEKPTLSILTHLPLMLFLIGSMLFKKFTGVNGYFDKQLFDTGEFIVISFLLIYCLNAKGYLDKGTNSMIAFFGLNIVFLTMILTGGCKHGIFRKRK